MTSSDRRRGWPFVIGVAGGTGSGKTTVVKAISGGLSGDGLLVIHHDFYYKDRGYLLPKERMEVNYDHPDALDNDLLIRNLGSLLNNQPATLPVYDFDVHLRKPDGLSVQPTKVIIIEGILILYEPKLRELFDLKIFVETDDDLRFIRRLQRDMHERGRTAESVVKQYLETVRPMHIEFVEHSKRYADVILPGGYNSGAVDMLVSSIRDKVSRLAKS